MQTHKVAGFTVKVTGPALTHPLLPVALERLRVRLEEIKKLSPKKLAGLSDEVIFWLTDSNIIASAMTYHPSKDWLKSMRLNADMARDVEITSVKNFLEWNVSGDQPMMVLHELVHAYHDHKLGVNHSSIKSAYDRAKRSGSYERVPYRVLNGTLMKAYALNNEQEYFAEVSEAFFGINDYFPFNREQLRAHDPEAFALCEKIWGK